MQYSLSKLLEYYGTTDYLNPEVSPLMQKSFEGLPKAYFQVCGRDPLRDEAFEYERRMRTAGIDTFVHTYPGLPHVFWSFPQLNSSKKWLVDMLQGVTWLLT